VRGGLHVLWNDGSILGRHTIFAEEAEDGLTTTPFFGTSFAARFGSYRKEVQIEASRPGTQISEGNSRSGVVQNFSYLEQYCKKTVPVRR
jgi:hypothetical protein